MKDKAALKKLMIIAVFCMVLIFVSACASANAPPAGGSSTVIIQPMDTQASAAPKTTPPAADAQSGDYDINVRLEYHISLDKSVEGTDPAIVRALRQALFDNDCQNAMFLHYNGYVKNEDVLVFQVDKTGDNTWEVRFREKEHADNTYFESDSYSFATVTKQESGKYIGEIVNPGGPMIDAGETY